MRYNAIGIAYLTCQWTFTVFGLAVVALRVYSRTFLTRSVGSDDFCIVIAHVSVVFISILIGRGANDQNSGTRDRSLSLRSERLSQWLVAA